MTFDDLIKPLLKREGGYVSHPNDKGGATNFGITQKVFSDWLASNAQQYRSVKSLTEDEAIKIYFDLYWTNAKCDLLPSSVVDIHFDASVNHGVGRAAKLLQGAAGTTQDGVIGPGTLKAVAAMSPDLLRMRYIAMRYRFYGLIIQRDRSQLAFIVGWMSRMAEFS